jgi:parvulin-like peptidyl-prolyl isomerase
MRRRGLMLVLLIATSRALGQGTDFVDRVVASVNTTVITYQQLEERTSDLNRLYARTDSPTKGRVPPLPAVRRRALDDLIDEELVLQRSKGSLRTEAAERYAQRGVEEQINDIRKQVGEEEFMSRLAQDNQSLEEFKAGMVAERTRQILVQQSRQSWLDEILLTPTPQSQIDKYLEEHKELAEEAGAPEVQFVFLRIPANAEPAGLEALRNKAEKILARARIGESFDQLVNEYSQHEQSKLRGGILPLLSRKSPYEEFGPLFDLEAGQVFPQVIEIEGWMCVAKVKTKQSVNNLVRKRIAQEELVKGLNDLRKEATIVLDHELFPSTEP